MKAKFKICQNTSLKDIQHVKDAIAEMSNKDNREPVIELLAVVNQLTTYGGLIDNKPESFTHEVSRVKTIGDMVIEVGSDYGAIIYLTAKFLIKGYICKDGRSMPFMAEVSNYAEWTENWLEFKEQADNGGNKSVSAFTVYYAENN